MKIGEQITKDNLPRCNGRPQLWWTDMPYHRDRFRIIYPSGKVEYIYTGHCSYAYGPLPIYRIWRKGCTTSGSQQVAQHACINYALTKRYETFFMGYL